MFKDHDRLILRLFQAVTYVVVLYKGFSYITPTSFSTSNQTSQDGFQAS